MQALLSRLGDPHRQMGVVLHVAGTNGKGSTCAFTESMVRAAGYRTGLFTSPHLTSARERIRFDGELVGEAEFVALEEDVAAAAMRLDDPPTFFERTAAMAFLGFARAGVDVAVIEVGLGGRLDATNVVEPRACAIAAVGLDHQAFLGETLLDIAAEKAGIIKQGVPVCALDDDSAVTALISARASASAAPFRPVRGSVEGELGLKGAHQTRNAALALALVEAAGLTLSDEAVSRGLAEARWPGRYEVVSGRPRVILDGAHNPQAAAVLRATVLADAELSGRPLGVLLGATSGHDPRPFARALFGADGLGDAPLWVTAPRTARAQAPGEVEVAIRGEVGARPVEVVADPRDAIRAALAWARGAGGSVLVTGSLYLVGSVRPEFIPMPMDPALPLY